MHEESNRMKPIFRNILAVIAGLVAGSMINGGILSLGNQLILPPEGTNVNDIESLKTAMHSFEPKHFISPFFAHAIGTLTGAFVAAWISTNNQLRHALIIGMVFLFGGVYMVSLLPSPIWFTALDLIVAYIPMAYLAYKLVGIIQNNLKINK